jgi:prevent-host-death family protein
VKAVRRCADERAGEFGSASLLQHPRATCVVVAADLNDYSGYRVEAAMREIQLRHAKATLSAVVDDAVRGEPCVITRHGRPEAVVIGFEEWQRLSNVPSFGRLLMSAPIAPGDLQERDRTPLRDIKV